MNSPQAYLIKDTVLHGGLIAAADAWLIVSALQGPLEQRAPDATTASTPAQPGACDLAARPAAAGQPAQKV